MHWHSKNNAAAILLYRCFLVLGRKHDFELVIVKRHVIKFPVLNIVLERFLIEPDLLLLVYRIYLLLIQLAPLFHLFEHSGRMLHINNHK